jgi:erythromycin esterase-like protein
MPSNSLDKKLPPVKTAPRALLEGLQKNLHSLVGDPQDYDLLLQVIATARYVLIGEASHGTQEFYRERVKITQRLILEKGFTAIAVEADWPDAWRVNRYVRGLSADPDAREALAGFERFPAWMWRNTEVCDFVEWLRKHNSGLGPEQQVGFYGMDLYSLFRSIEEVLSYLDRTDPVQALRARARYACFDHVGQDSQAYGYGAAYGMARSCEDEVVQQLRDMTQRLAQNPSMPSSARDEYFYAQQNARLVRNAEEYYRSMFRGRISSWNLRDSHMVETLLALSNHLSQGATVPRMVVWAHNSHLGDAGVTDMGDRGEWNVGQLMRERFGTDAFLIGMSTHHGTVTAASEWDEPPQRKRVRPGLEGSWEAIFHQVGTPNFMLLLKDHTELLNLTEALRLQRAIGVIYRPETERQSHYFFTHLARQFDALLHLDETHALEPLDKDLAWQAGAAGEVPETYPSGI